jgi:hypothetical protein
LHKSQVVPESVYPESHAQLTPVEGLLFKTLQVVQAEVVQTEQKCPQGSQVVPESAYPVLQAQSTPVEGLL